ncbi:MAG: carboxypeptidase M32, partial [Actinobacteria bacterium]|nr:carboxypeptidase M32 [Actinomycetota bacterium]
LAEIHDLRKTRALLSWDQQVKMPPGGGGVRAEQLATLDRLAHDLFVADETGRLLERLQPWAEAQEHDSDEASLVRVTHRDWEKERRVPGQLRADMSRAASLALPVWAQARADSDFASFLPHLRKNIDLRRRYIECFDDYDEPYDVVLDDFEPGMKAAEVRIVFDRLKEEQVPLAAAAARSGERPARDRAFPLEAQGRFELAVLERFGFDRASWRLDPTVHPFATTIAIDDVRLTTRYHETNLDGLFASMHEYGHGLYEHGVARELERTPLARGTSLGLHESQSRLWENLVGRSLPFWRFFYPQLQAHFPETLGKVELDDWYRSVNWVQPSLVRVEADEATYNLHVILRFELEQEILSGAVALEDLPDAWNARMAEYVGIEPPNDRLGVLQDVHWSGGHIGYFATYALGNVISAQIWERVNAAIPDLEVQFESGEFGELRTWLTENLYRHGRKFTPKVTLERLVGGPIDAGPYLRYLRAKLATLA